jgi:hypothetical protein
MNCYMERWLCNLILIVGPFLKVGLFLYKPYKLHSYSKHTIADR